jgi:hypothetical protein
MQSGVGKEEKTTHYVIFIEETRNKWEENKDLIIFYTLFLYFLTSLHVMIAKTRCFLFSSIKNALKERIMQTMNPANL